MRAMPTPSPSAPRCVVSELEKHILVDGFQIVIDFDKSRGSRIHDSVTGREIIDLYGFFGSLAIGFNHPHFDQPEVLRELAHVARWKVANSDMYSAYYADFVSAFARVAPLPPLNRYFFIDGGALAVENALKTAMDWKVRKNLAAGKGERGTHILHFQHAFHGRSGYTMSLTNTDPKKIMYFAKFPWPRVSSPFIDHALPEEEREADVIRREQKSEAEIMQFVREQGDDIAAIIIEPIQGEGGDNHFRPEWLQKLRQICDENEMLLIFDEVQTGLGATGKMWGCEHYGVRPDLLAFGKKVQACGVMAGPRLDEVKDNCFRLPSRINSTWGGNLVDMVRSTHNLQIIEKENLVEHVAKMGALFLDELGRIAIDEPAISAVRGLGSWVAFDLPSPAAREEFYRGLYNHGVLAIRSGEKSIRFRPALDIKEADVLESCARIAQTCRDLRRDHAQVLATA